MSKPEDARPVRDRPLMPNVHNVAGKHRGEPGPGEYYCGLCRGFVPIEHFPHGDGE